jgi:hypothetical protein
MKRGTISWGRWKREFVIETDMDGSGSRDGYSMGRGRNWGKGIRVGNVEELERWRVISR